MLSTVSLAFLVPFISAAVLHPDSPDSNHAIFQDLNTTSLVTPLSVTGRLSNTSISIPALTTNSSSLGVVNTQAYSPPPRYPPGYPGQPYDYYVRYSNLRIHCTRFRPDPLQNDEQLDSLFQELQLEYSDPRDHSVHLWDDGMGQHEWLEGDERIAESVLGVLSPFLLTRDRISI